MKFLVLGLGSIGKRHIMNMLSLGISADDLIGVDTREDRRNEIQKKFALKKVYPDLKVLEDCRCNAAFICTPTSLHMQQATLLANEGMHLFIEKPLANDLNGIEDLLKAVKKNNLKVLMAYIFRFAPSVVKLKEVVDSGIIGKILYFHVEFSEYLPDCHPWEDYRTFYMAKKSLGGGSLLDQSHAIDLAYYLFGDIHKVYCVNGKFSDLEVDSDDIAEMIMKLNSKLTGSIHMDMFGRNHQKYIEIKGAQGNLFWSFYDYCVKVYRAEEKKWESWQFKKDPNEMYIYETKHFLECLQKNQRPKVTLEDGIHIMKAIQAAKESNKAKKPVAVK